MENEDGTYIFNNTPKKLSENDTFSLFCLKILLVRSSSRTSFGDRA